MPRTKIRQKYENGAVITFSFHDKVDMKLSEHEAEPKIILQSNSNSPTAIPVIAVSFVLVMDVFFALLLLDCNSKIEHMCIVIASLLLHIGIANVIREACSTIRITETVIRFVFLFGVYIQFIQITLSETRLLKNLEVSLYSIFS